jgi:Family of unknown function (DUF5681)
MSPVKNSTTTGGGHTRFRPGVSGNPKGRPPGAKNRATREVKAFAHRVLSDPIYRRNFLRRMRSLEPPAHLETLLFHYAFGKPAQSVELSGGFNHAEYLASKSPDQEEL